MAATYEPIATTTLGTATSSITFSSIAASWTDLRLVLNFSKETTGNQAPLLRFNSDTGTNYSSTNVRGDGSAAASSRTIGYTALWDGVGFLSNPTPGLITTDIFSYTGSTYKTALTTKSYDMNGSGQTINEVGLWRSTAAITSITISATTNFAIGTIATLYGIKAA